jgi:hypothetical protein
MSAVPPVPVAVPDTMVPSAYTPAVAPALTALPRSPSVWAEGWARLRGDRVGIVSLIVVLVFMMLVLLAQCPAALHRCGGARAS